MSDEKVAILKHWLVKDVADRKDLVDFTANYLPATPHEIRV